MSWHERRRDPMFEEPYESAKPVDAAVRQLEQAGYRVSVDCATIGATPRDDVRPRAR